MDRPNVHWWHRLGTVALAATWFVNVALLLTAFIWVYRDGQSERVIELIGSELVFRNGQLAAIIAKPSKLGTDVAIATCATVGVAITSLIICGGLFFGGRSFRSLRMWLLFTALISGWLGFLASWPEVHWFGQQRRMISLLAPVEEFARYLDANWPSDDGELPGIGPYLAYPKGGPMTVLPINWTTFPHTALRFSAIERTNDGALRFELTGNEAGAWLEWRPDDLAAEPFVSGLDTTFNVQRQQRLAPRWFLVRYRPGPLGSTL